MITINNQSLNDFLNIDFNNLAEFLANIPPLQLAVIGSLIGTLLSVPLNYEEQSTLGNFFELIGQAMLVVSAQGFNLQTKEPTNQSQAINDLQKQINRLNERLNNLYRNY